MSKVAVVFWSGTGNTEAMANAVAAGAKDKGAEVSVMGPSDFGASAVAEYDGIAFGCPAMGAEYPGIRTPRELYEALGRLWCAETCTPRMRKDWSPQNPTLGQCAITAFLAQDIFGGRVWGVPLEDGNFHCFNAAGDRVFDLTSEQFGDRKLDYTLRYEQLRHDHFMKPGKRERYEALKEALKQELKP